MQYAYASMVKEDTIQRCKQRVAFKRNHTLPAFACLFANGNQATSSRPGTFIVGLSGSFFLRMLSFTRFLFYLFSIFIWNQFQIRLLKPLSNIFIVVNLVEIKDNSLYIIKSYKVRESLKNNEGGDL